VMIFNSVRTFRLAISKVKYLDGLKFIGTYQSCGYSNVTLLDRLYMRI